MYRQQTSADAASLRPAECAPLFTLCSYYIEYRRFLQGFAAKIQTCCTIFLNSMTFLKTNPTFLRLFSGQAQNGVEKLSFSCAHPRAAGFLRRQRPAGGAGKRKKPARRGVAPPPGRRADRVFLLAVCGHAAAGCPPPCRKPAVPGASAGVTQTFSGSRRPGGISGCPGSF